MKIFHIADSHLKNNKHHSEYRDIFKQIEEKIIEEKPDVIIHCGDIAHTKTQISPEFIDLCSEFFDILSRYCPLYIILGNHDCSLSNKQRQDAISPIVSLLNRSNIHLLKNSQVVSLNENINFHVLSILDPENWNLNVDDSKINIVLYHGAIQNVKTDTNFELLHGISRDLFAPFDMAFLGDIHKTFQRFGPKNNYLYPGSTVQQGFGETNDKGFAIWDIKGKDHFSVKHCELINPKPFLSLYINDINNLPKKIIKGCYLRIFLQNHFSKKEISDIKNYYNNNFSPECIIVINKESKVENNSQISHIGNFRNVDVQDQLILDSLKQHEISDELKRSILSLNHEYQQKLVNSSNISQYTNFNIIELKWKNLFIFRGENSLKFDDFAGILGIFGKSYSGKSSIIDILLFSIYNTTSKNIPNGKSVFLINNEEDEASCSVSIQLNNKIYIIERTLKVLYKKGVRDCKATVNFYELQNDEKISLNENSKTETELKIQDFFGTPEIFLITNLSAQFNNLKFIDAKSTPRKEILSTLVDLGIFEKKYDFANEDYKIIKNDLSKFDDFNFDFQLKEINSQIENINKEIEECSEEKSILEESIKQNNIELLKIESELKNVSNLNFNSDVESLKKQKEKLTSELLDEKQKLINKNAEQTGLEEQIKLLNESIESFNKEENEKKLEKKNHVSSLASKIKIDLSAINAQLDLISSSSINILKEIPCGEQFPTCPFIKQSFQNKDKSLMLSDQKNELTSVLQKYSNEIGNLQQHEKERKQYDETFSKVQNLLQNKNLVLSSIENTNLKIKNLTETIQKTSESIRFAEQHQEALKNASSLRNKRQKKIFDIQASQKKLSSIFDIISKNNRKIGELENERKHLHSRNDSFQILSNRAKQYQIFLELFHYNGIPSQIFQKVIPKLNDEINEITKNIIDFQILLTCQNNNKIEIFIQKPKKEPYPLELGSGTEKQIADIAIRLAFASISSVPNPNLFIMDEPGTMLDNEHLDSFSKILEIIKTKFNLIILISHLPSMQDCVDNIINTEIDDGVSYLMSE